MQFFGTSGIHHYESKLTSHLGPFSPFFVDQLRNSAKHHGASTKGKIPGDVLKAVVADAFKALFEKQAELWRAMEVRLNLLEGSVGDGAACVRNLASSKSTEGCVDKVAVDGINGTCCLWLEVPREGSRAVVV